MSAPPTPSGFFVLTLDNVKSAALAGTLVSGLITLLRIGDRVHTRRFGYDDGWAAFALAIFVLFDVALYTHLADPTHLTHVTRVSLYYILAQTFYGVVWAARMSILFSVIRICPNGTPLKKVLWGLAGSFVFVWIILFAQVFWVCEAEPGWKDVPNPQCALGRNVAIAQLISDIYADSMLIAAPLRLLWNLKTSPAQRNRLIFVFASSIITTISSLIHAYYVLNVGGLDEVFVAIIEMAVSLTISNLAVVVALGARVFKLGTFTNSKGGSGISGGSYQMSRSPNRSGTGTTGTNQYTLHGNSMHTVSHLHSQFDPKASTLGDSETNLPIKSHGLDVEPGHGDSFLDDTKWSSPKNQKRGSFIGPNGKSAPGSVIDIGHGGVGVHVTTDSYVV